MGQDTNRLVGLEGPKGEDCKVSFRFCLGSFFCLIPSSAFCSGLLGILLVYLDMASAVGVEKKLVDQLHKT